MSIVHLRSHGTSLVLDARGSRLPAVQYWGSDLGDLTEAELEAMVSAQVPAIANNTLYVPRRTAVLPQHADGYAGRAVLTGRRPGAGWSPQFTTTAIRTGDSGVEIEAVDAGLMLVTELRLDHVLRMRHTLHNTAGGDYELLALPMVLPVPPHATDLLDVTGRHLKERVPQRLPFRFGAWVREQRRGRTGHDAPLLLAAGSPGFGFRHGEVWAVHLGWSGDFTTFAERMVDGWSCVGAGELLMPEELVLAEGESYSTPWLHAVYSDRGLDGIADAHHAELRAQHPRGPRPVVLNTWEAVYFDHDLSRLKALADVAAEVGAERFVLDDGWFGSRRDDTSGLGDWTVSVDVWPDGLHPLVDHVTGLGMQFGLWVEPEMANPDSDLVRAHPDWLLAVPGRTPPPSRHQQPVNLANPSAYAYLLGALSALLDEYAIGYLKWDHNRDLVDANGVHAQTLALYRLLDELRSRYPQVEIESCSSGGGRVDLGILQRTDRIWASDCNDPLERQQIERWTGLVVPPEMIGSHVGPPRAHTTGRPADLSFRAGTALFGHFGIEWDISSASSDEQRELAAWIAVYKRFRGLVHSGVTVRGDQVDDGALVRGVVSADLHEGLFSYVQLATTTSAPPPPIRLPGLDPALRYRVEPIRVEPPVTIGKAEPPWWLLDEITLPATVLTQIGLQAPLLGPQQLIVLHLTATT